MTYAVIQTGGKQYQISVGDEILFDKIDIEKGKQISFTEVLLIRTDNKIVIGNPHVAGGKVTGKVLDHLKGEKIKVAKFKAKVRFRRTTGFRPYYTKILIEKIELSEEKSSRKKIDNQAKKSLQKIVKSRLTPVK